MTQSLKQNVCYSSILKTMSKSYNQHLPKHSRFTHAYSKANITDRSILAYTDYIVTVIMSFYRF